MSALLLSTLTASSTQEKLYVDDVFSTYLYQGNGSTQTINNGIDLAGEGGLVWIKARNQSYDNALSDSARGKSSTYYKWLISNKTDAEVGAGASQGVTDFLSTGFSVGMSNGAYFNASSTNYVSWTFLKAAKFFEVVTVNHVNGAQSNIDLSQLAQIGFVTVKRLDQTSNWLTWHRSLSAGNLMYLNATNAQTADASLSVSGATLSIDASVPSGQYVVYAWAHDPNADGIIQCGSIVNPLGSGQQVTLGWEPQFVLWKRTDSTGDWNTHDVIRGVSNPEFSQVAPVLFPNLSNAETTNARISVSANGFSFNPPASTATYIYLAIRRPNKPPTSGTQVYNAIARTGTGAAATVTGVGFAPDFIHSKRRSSSTYGGFFSRLVGFDKTLQTHLTQSEYALISEGIPVVGMDGFSIGADGSNGFFNQPSGSPYVHHFFRRAPGFMDVVCDTGTGAAHAIAHNLTKAPELIIRKSRSAATQWEVWHSALAATEKLVLNSDAAKATDTTAWNSTVPTATQITVGTGASVNANTATFVTYLFATLDGISKVGSYTGNGSTLNIDAGFGANGPAFILIKRTDSTGDWYLWDSARGIVSGNDPHLSLNTTAAEVTTDDSVDPTAGGFAVNQNTATNINVSSGTYIYLAIAGGVYVPSGEAVFTTPGTYNWTVPEGVTSVCVVCVGGGGGGGDLGIVGGTSSFSSVLSVTGGKNSGATGIYSGGSPTGQDGGGNGGYSYQGVGGGGAGGYSGNGGGGGNNTSLNGVNGTGGGGGGGATYGNGYGGTGGGGVGLYGQGTNGLGSIYVTNASPGGGGGSGGSAGGNAIASAASNGGSYGGGGGAYGSYGGGGGGLGYKNNIAVIPGSLISVSVGSGGSNGGSSSGGNGGSGAVRIIWGYGRSFPYNAA